MRTASQVQSLLEVKVPHVNVVLKRIGPDLWHGQSHVCPPDALIRTSAIAWVKPCRTRRGAARSSNGRLFGCF